MKTKILIVGTVCILAVVIIASAGLVSGAWFFDTKIVPGSVITSGTLDLSIKGEPLKATGLEPGKDYLSMGTFCIKNTGTTDLKFRGLFEVNAPTTHKLLAYTTLKVELQTVAGWIIQKEIFGDSKTDPLVDYFKFPDQDKSVINQFIVTDSLSPDQEICYRLAVKLDSNTPDNLQDKLINFVLHLYATQETNPGWD